MANLHSYYVLCPLIDQKSFLDVSIDKEIDHVVVTLGRNIVNKYRLSDQKQIGGWTSKDHITSAVIYDEDTDSYVGVFNNNVIKIWKHDVENIEKVKKHKFTIPIIKLIPRKNQSALIVFTNGNCVSLSYGLENRKSCEIKTFLKKDETITDVSCYSYNNTDYICYILKNDRGTYEIVHCPLRYELGDLDKPKLSRHKIKQDAQVDVVGKLICTSDVAAVYIVCSDAKMSIYDLTKNSWKSVGTIPWISTASKVSMTWIGENHLILFGSDTEQDGAIILAYNVSLGIGTCRYPMKMYCENAKLYYYNNHIILEAGNHLGILPFTLETSRSLATLLASHDIMQQESTEIADWGVGEASMCQEEGEIKELLKLGLTERTICSQILPPLLETDDPAHLHDVIKEFNDIPENIIVMLLDYCIKVTECDVDISNKVEFKQFCLKENEKMNLLKVVFDLPFSDALLIPHLRNGLTLDKALFLLTYIWYLLEDNDEMFDVHYESKLLDWCSLVMDAFYQQYLMTKDPNVTKTLDSMKEYVEKLINQLDEFNCVLPMLNNLICKKSLDTTDKSLSYSIELLEI